MPRRTANPDLPTAAKAPWPRRWLLLGAALGLAWSGGPSALRAATPAEICNVYKKGDPARAATLGTNALLAAPENIELLLTTGRALTDLGRYQEALPHLEKVVRLDRRQTWQAAWASSYAGYAHFGLGHLAATRTALAGAVAMQATPEVTAHATKAQKLLGFASLYQSWVTLESEFFRFHFSPAHRGLDTNQFAKTHERAYKKINGFFAASPPKKLDFFVWTSSAEAEAAGVGRLGFARPELGLVHAHHKQTVGHEMTHVLCYQGLKPATRNAFINEGIAVYFDQTRRDRLAQAAGALREAGLAFISVENLWANLRQHPEVVTYPVAGAFVERLVQKGGEEALRALAREQSLESARKIYGQNLGRWMADFEADLVNQARQLPP